MATVLDKLITELRFDPDIRELRKFESSVNKVRRNLDATSRAFAVAGTALTGALFGASSVILPFEEEMNRLRRDTGATAEEFAALREQAIRLGSSSDYTTISVRDAARAQRELVKSGLSIKEAMVALPGVLNLVAATEIDVGEAALKTSKLIKAYGLEVEDIPRIHDLVAHSAVNAGITAEQLIDNLLRSGATARAAGISIEDMVASMSLLVDQGQISERAATSFERTLTQLSKASVLPPAAIKAFESLGINIEDVEKLMSEGKIIEIMSNLATAGLDVATASQIFGEDGARAALTLAQNAGKLRDFRDGLNDVEGAMKRQADIMNEGFPGAVNALKSSFETAIVALGDAGLTGYLQRFAETASVAVQWFQNLSDENKGLVAGALAAGPVLLGLSLGLKALSFALGGLVPIMRTARTAASLMWLALTGPVGLAAIAFAAALIVAWEPVSTFFIGLWEGLTAGTGEVGVAFDALMTALGPIGDGIVAIFGLVKDAWNEVVGFFDSDQSEAGKAWGASIIATTVLVIEAITGMVNWIRSEWNAMLEWFDGPGKDESLLSWLWAPVAGMFGWITGAWDAVLAWLGVPEEVFAWLGEIEAGIFNWITDAWQAVLDWFSGPGKDQSILSWLFEPHAGLFGWIINAWETVLTWLGVPEEVFSWLGEIEAGIFNWITDAWQAVLDWFSGPGKDQSILSWLFEPHAGLFGWIINAWETVLTWLGVPEEVFSWLGEIEAGIFNWITDAWQAVLDWFSGPGKDQSILSWLFEPHAGLFGWIINAWETVLTWLGVPEEVFSWLGEIQVGVFDWVKTAWDTMLGWLTAPSLLWDWLVPNIDADTILNPIKTAWDTVTDWLASFSLADSGEALIQTLVDGIVAVKDLIKAKVKESLGFIGSLLPDSDAREGPLSRLTEAGRAIIETLADGVANADPLKASLLAGALSLPVGPLPAGATTNSAITITINDGAIQINVASGDAREIAGAVGKELREQLRAAAEQADNNVLA